MKASLRLLYKIVTCVLRSATKNAFCTQYCNDKQSQTSEFDKTDSNFYLLQRKQIPVKTLLQKANPSQKLQEHLLKVAPQLALVT